MSRDGRRKKKKKHNEIKAKFKQAAMCLISMDIGTEAR